MQAKFTGLFSSTGGKQAKKRKGKKKRAHADAAKDIAWYWHKVWRIDQHSCALCGSKRNSTEFCNRRSIVKKDDVHHNAETRERESGRGRRDLNINLNISRSRKFCGNRRREREITIAKHLVAGHPKLAAAKKNEEWRMENGERRRFCFIFLQTRKMKENERKGKHCKSCRLAECRGSMRDCPVECILCVWDWLNWEREREREAV